MPNRVFKKIAYIWNESSSLRRKPIVQSLSDLSKEMGGCKRACILLAAAFIQLPQGCEVLQVLSQARPVTPKMKQQA